ncbi:3-isopropylmalate dehydrogenase [Tissierella creatinophila]|uniref:3-isopropylmalate dehydrogenase n=1 Tax=Tissierella creatinophila DSM 6911 TaxID=1123403 RepID=A0A1U7M5T8_TISCR|nr:3-isopropylmalate dehydrogenase [Tissierella creatinophila]OLS02646.1 3-isopropylmalate dehydrogenase [Tissierella creatinophila DSM 6911]
MDYKIAIAKGDGIGPEIVESAMEVLDVIGKIKGHKFIYKEAPVGGFAYDLYGDPLPLESIKTCKESDSVLFGAVGGPKWDNLPGDKRAETAILGLRKNLETFANLRPGYLFKSLKDASPLKESIIGDGFDILVVRELTGGIYFGEKGYKETENGKAAFDIEIYSEMEIERIARIGFEMAMKRDKKLTSVDKSNVLESSRLWRKVVEEVSKDYKEVSLNHMYIDNAAMQVIRDPKQFDVILTSNIFGDILSDEISMITGSIGMLASASIGKDKKGIFEPIHGSAPDITGKGIANPIATILSAAMMLKYSFGLEEESKMIEDGVAKTLEEGYRTSDIRGDGDWIKTGEMTEKIIKTIQKMVQN